MSGIACPFCQKKFQAQDLITHCRICRALQAEANSAAQLSKADTKKSRPSVDSNERASSRASEDPPSRWAPETAKFPMARKEPEYSPPRQSSVDLIPGTPELGDGDGDSGSEPRAECPHCGRKFVESRLEKHINACAKLSTRRVPSFNPHDQRWKDVSKDDRQLVNEVEPATPMSMSRSTTKSRTPARKKLNWSTADPKSNFGQEKSAFNPTYDDTVIESRSPVKHSPPPQHEAAPQKPRAAEKPAPPQSPQRPQSVAKNDEPTDQRSAPDSAFTTSAIESKHRHRHRHRHGHTPRISSDGARYMSNTPSGPGVAPVYTTAPLMQSFQPIHSYQQPSTVTIPSGIPGVPSRIMATPPEVCSFCIYCGLKFHQDALFCGNCGSKRQSYEQLYGSS